LQPWELLEGEDPSLSVALQCDALIIGCGNVLRGDDAAGSVLIHRLWEDPRLATQLAAPMEIYDSADNYGVNIAENTAVTTTATTSTLHVRLVDAGTSGMDTAFQMRGAARCILVDACLTGSEPGTVFKVPAAQIADIPDVGNLTSHGFRWDHAIALGRWLLGPLMPADIEVYLIEAGQLEFCEPLSDAVSSAVDKVATRILDGLGLR
jgi:hydrogenase maturation protease